MSELENEIAKAEDKATGNGWSARDIAQLVVALTALLAALLSAFRPETSARKVYDATSQADTKLSKDIQSQHEDIAVIQAYLQKEHTDPIPLMVVASDAGTFPKQLDAGLIAVAVRSEARPPPASKTREPVGFKPAPYENVTGTTDTTVRVP